MHDEKSNNEKLKIISITVIYFTNKIAWQHFATKMFETLLGHGIPDLDSIFAISIFHCSQNFARLRDNVNL
jgi:hypothetical protein